jgi:hypothetical protein
MNSDESVVHEQPSASDLTSKQHSSAWDLVKRLLLCNPFYLCSAGLLLYGINRLSTDENLFSSDVHNLLFNFGALQIYEVLLVVTAIVLAARRVWYDSALLVVLENGLVMMPFMLISHATFIDKRLGWTLSLVAALAAAGRFYAIFGKYPQFNMPSRAMLLGLAVLSVNVALPHVFRVWVESDFEPWKGPDRLLWYAVLPVIAALANLLPRPTKYGGLNPERSWLPLFNYGLWLIGSGVHIWCLNHIANLPFGPVLIAPTVSVCAWTLYNRLPDCLPNPSAPLKQSMLGFAFITPLLAAANPVVLTTLSGLNLAGFILVTAVGETAVRRAAKEFAFATAALMFAALPRELLPGLNRQEQILGATVLFCILSALRSRDPRVGLLGAAGLAMGVGWLARDWSVHATIQASCVFLLSHSLWWAKGVHRGADFLRAAVSLVWVSSAFFWTRDVNWVATGGVASAAFLVLILSVLCLLRTGAAPPLVPISAVVALCTGPGNWFYANAPAGVIALAGSVVLFVAGTLIAWHRHAWDRTGPTDLGGYDQ